MTSDKRQPLEGGCTCGKIRYRLKAEPMITHCCHCRWCQRETGAAFAVNAVIETSEVELLAEAPVIIDTPSNSGRGQLIARCPSCHVAVWSHYGSARERAAFIRAGTLDVPAQVPPDVHIFTSSKLPWVTLTDGKPVFAEFYPGRKGVWSEAADARWKVLMQPG